MSFMVECRVIVVSWYHLSLKFPCMVGYYWRLKHLMVHLILLD